jgi:hypothetical protein
MTTLVVITLFLCPLFLLGSYIEIAYLLDSVRWSSTPLSRENWPCEITRPKKRSIYESRTYAVIWRGPRLAALV